MQRIHSCLIYLDGNSSRINLLDDISLTPWWLPWEWWHHCFNDPFACCNIQSRNLCWCPTSWGIGTVTFASRSSFWGCRHVSPLHLRLLTASIALGALLCMGCLSHYDAQTLVTHPASELGSYWVHSTLQPSSLPKTQYIFPTEIDEYLIG